MEEYIKHFIETVLRIFKLLVSFLKVYTKKILRLDEFTNLSGRGNGEIVSCYSRGPSLLLPCFTPSPHAFSLVLFPS